MATNNPFPGMNPFLEREWEDVHTALIVHAKEQLQSVLPADLKARAQQRVFLEAEDSPRSRDLVPDAYVVERPGADGGGAALAVEAEVAEPLVIRIRSEPARQGFIEIRDKRSGGRVVSVIEFVSPSNKVPGKGRDLYHQKREECWEASVNFVEIDLTRRRPLNLMVSAEQLPDKGEHPYHACVWRATPPGQCEVYAFSLRQALPAIRVPLRATDEDARLALQPLVDRVMTAGGYDDIDYTAPLDLPLAQDDAQWLSERLGSGTTPEKASNS